MTSTPLHHFKRGVTRIRWTFVELWGDLRYGKHRRQTLRHYLCEFGLHWPITFWDCRGGYSSPPEAGWACETCGHERLPWRAWLWRVPVVSRWVP